MLALALPGNVKRGSANRALPPSIRVGGFRLEEVLQRVQVRLHISTEAGCQERLGEAEEAAAHRVRDIGLL
jgi:hypothetical protein